MEFRTRTVVRRKNKKAWIAYGGLFIAMSSLILVFIPPLEDYIPWVFGTGIAVVVIGAFIARGDVATYGLGEADLIVSIDGIGIGEAWYPMPKISKLDFNIEAFEGLYVNDGAMVSGSKSDGMTNSVSFDVHGKTVSTGFYLSSAQHVQMLGLIFKAYYEGHIPFIERNKNTQTYLFQFLSGKELEAFKKLYGYN